MCKEMTNLSLQQQAAILHLREWRVGALFMEPGTGKTRAAMTLINSSSASDCFWVGPLRTLPSVQAEMAKWGGMKMPTSFWGVESIGQSDRIYMNLLNAVDASACPFLVVDESLKIKNAEAKRTRRLLELGKHAEWKLVLNGTPVSRNLLDMWSQMEFLSPKILNMTLTQFKNTFCSWTKVTKRIGHRSYVKEFITGMENVDYLHSLIRHYIYECDLHLQIRQKWHTVRYYISESSRTSYERLKKQWLSDESLSWNNNNIFLSMTISMQMCYCVDENKLAALSGLMSSVPEDETIIFCRFVSSHSACSKMFPRAAVLSMQKESLGLNLQRYRHMVFFDKVWDYALILQASRRTYRTGQEQDCHYYVMTGDTGLDRLIEQNIDKKVSMSEYLKKVTKEEMRKEL